ncbi:hypothetical protein [Streptomyces sp. H27-S2]|uniref:hypothetical protein n=1 Tax=Streptomyces antarcticus TaxID=2996458 RepID=UPI00226D6FF8|nr:hypothetical protein [Streptomyces sp. H27-S2]MCY0953190.1 hypothetical protein [Streptomyces sp. H27-S2]
MAWMLSAGPGATDRTSDAALAAAMMLTARKAEVLTDKVTPGDEECEGNSVGCAPCSANSALGTALGERAEHAEHGGVDAGVVRWCGTLGQLVEAKAWVEEQVPYSTNGLIAPYSWWADGCTGGRYRQDCSGFVSMAWQLTGSPTTMPLPNVSTAINKWDLKPGDILNSDDHVVLFAGWRDKSASTFNYYQESSRSRPTNYNTDGNLYGSMLASHPTSSYSALRYGFRAEGDVPLVGDWNGDGTDKVGVYRPAESDFFGAAKDSNTVIYKTRFGNPGDIPVTGQR